ncbi:hypothetical protein ARMGADRAFT_816832 [Armillaria gallica]|uniref:Uncharacterized protein n=1 Tax=Armillaria gallica TaxID=47427 RepID=A0A2H3CGQ8_ARMGA|nr:hypothetical protein ARMGADRAFT_816832 [Armillaria gallica]
MNIPLPKHPCQRVHVLDKELEPLGGGDHSTSQYLIYYDPFIFPIFIVMFLRCLNGYVSGLMIALVLKVDGQM